MQVLDAIPSEVEVGYLRLHNDFCSIGEDYLLGKRPFLFFYCSDYFLQASNSLVYDLTSPSPKKKK